MKALLAAIAGALLVACASVPGPAPPAALDAMRAHPERLVVVAVANPRPGGSTVAGSTAAAYAAPLQPYLGGAEARRTLAAIVREYGLAERVAWPIAALRLHCAVLEVPAAASREALLRALARDVRIAVAQPLHEYVVLAQPLREQVAPPAGAAVYNDPYAPLQHGLAEVEAARAHRASRGHGVAVALIDTGADVDHPDLRGRVAAARNFVDRDAEQFGRDRHGTGVAGVIAALANNGEGIVGIAPEAELRVYKACWSGADGRARCNAFTLALALAAGLDDGARVFNLSLAGPPDELLGRLVGQAIAQGRIVVGAVPPGGALDGFPLGVAGVVAVDASGRPGAGRAHGVLFAPGRDILTTVPGGRYDFDSGTSLAAAHVSGVAAVLLGMPESPRAEAVRRALDAGRTAAGSISACAAIAALRGAAGDCGPR